jgi:chromosome partitioning protein
MKVVALSSRKGGAGKSTIAVHLAVAAEAAGLATAIFDLDPQASSALWSDHRGEPIPAVVPAQAPRLRALLKQAVENNADLVLLDTPPHADGVAAEAGAVADAVLIPCRPSAFDLDAIGASVRLAQAAKRPCWVIINAAPIQGVEVEETREALRAAGVQVSPVVIHQRKAFASRIHEGRTATEIEPGGKAAAEIEALLAWLCDQVIQFPREPATKIAGDQDISASRKPVTSHSDDDCRLPAPETDIQATKVTNRRGNRVARS